MAALMVPMKAFQMIHCMVIYFYLLMVYSIGPTFVVSDGRNDSMFEESALIVPH